MAAGVARGRRPELHRGGLRRSGGGWAAVALLRRGREPWAAEERILGSGPFVEQILRESAPRVPRYFRAHAAAAVPEVVKRCAAAFAGETGEVYGGSRRRPIAQVRVAVSYLAVTHLGLSAAAVSAAVGVTPADVLRGVHRTLEMFPAQRLEPKDLLPRTKHNV